MIQFSETLHKHYETGARAQHMPAPRSAAMTFRPSDLESIPLENVKLGLSTRIALVNNPSSAEADRFRFLRMQFRQLKESIKLQRVVITSPLPRDGKSTIAVNLATALAEGGKRAVLLIDGDLYRPALAAILGLNPRPGLAECVENGLNPVSAICRLESLNWYLMQAGSPKSNPSEVLQSAAAGQILRSLGEAFDWVLIDSPPILPLTDALCLGTQANASHLLVVKANSTPQPAVEQAVARLGPKNVFGIILNCTDGLDRLYSEYYRSYSRGK